MISGKSIYMYLEKSLVAEFVHVHDLEPIGKYSYSYFDDIKRGGGVGGLNGIHWHLVIVISRSNTFLESSFLFNVTRV